LAFPKIPNLFSFDWVPPPSMRSSSSSEPSGRKTVLAIFLVDAPPLKEISLEHSLYALFATGLFPGPSSRTTCTTSLSVACRMGLFCSRILSPVPFRGCSLFLKNFLVHPPPSGRTGPFPGIGRTILPFAFVFTPPV